MMNAFWGGGTARTVFNLAGGLAERHDVEIVSVYRHEEALPYPLHDGVRVSSLTDSSPSAWRRMPAPVRPLRRAARLGLRALPSRVINPLDPRYRSFSRLNDRPLLDYLQGLDGGALITTRVGLNLAAATFAPPSVIRIAQEHLHLARYRKALVADIARIYPALDAVATLTEADAEHYRKTLGPGSRVVAIPNAAPDTGPGAAPLTEKVAIAVGR